MVSIDWVLQSDYDVLLKISISTAHFWDVLTRHTIILLHGALTACPVVNSLVQILMPVHQPSLEGIFESEHQSLNGGSRAIIAGPQGWRVEFSRKDRGPGGGRGGGRDDFRGGGDRGGGGMRSEMKCAPDLASLLHIRDLTSPLHIGS